MVYKKRSTFLSSRAYRLLKRARAAYIPAGDEKTVYDALKRRELLQKDELREATGLEKPPFEKAFYTLLENMLVTAYSGRRIRHNWYSYVYCCVLHRRVLGKTVRRASYKRRSQGGAIKAFSWHGGRKKHTSVVEIAQFFCYNNAYG